MFRRVADGFNSGKGTVEFTEHGVDGTGGQDSLAGVVVACVAAEDVLVMDAAKLQILAHAGTAHQAEALAPAFPCAPGPPLWRKLFLEMNKDGVLMSRDHDIDVIRGNDAKPTGAGVISGSPSITSFSRLVSMRP